jgi:hypothetical protein
LRLSALVAVREVRLARVLAVPVMMGPLASTVVWVPVQA